MLPPEYNFDSKVKRLCERLKNICLKSVPGNQIVANVKIKIVSVEYPPPRLENRAGDLTPKKKILQSQWT